MPHFFVDDAFADSKEVMAIPARHRNAAVGLWTRCGAWSASKLTNGFIPTEVLQMFGAKPPLVSALVESAELWDQVSGGVCFRNWDKWQRTRDQVVSFREKQTAKKRRQREASTSEDEELSPGGHPEDTHDPCPQGIPHTPTPSPKPSPKYVTPYVDNPPHVSNAPAHAQRGREGALARFQKLNETAASPIALQASQALSDTLRQPLPLKTQTGVAKAIDECLEAGIALDAIPAGFQEWTNSDSFSPTQLPNYVHKANNRLPPGKATNKAVNYGDTLIELIKEIPA